MSTSWHSGEENDSLCSFQKKNVSIFNTLYQKLWQAKCIFSNFNAYIRNQEYETFEKRIFLSLSSWGNTILIHKIRDATNRTFIHRTEISTRCQRKWLERRVGKMISSWRQFNLNLICFPLGYPSQVHGMNL